MSDEIIGFVVERIADLVAEEVNLLRGARSEFRSLQRELEMMQSFLIDADAKLEAGDERLRAAVRQIREMAYETEDLIDSFKPRESKNLLKMITSVCSCLVQIHRAGTKVKELKKRIKETTDRLQTYQVGTNVEVSPKTRPKSYPYSIGDDYVVGFDNDVENLVQQIINPQINFLAIVGMGGSGKTTLARKIYNHPQISDKFPCKAWICVSQVWNNESLLREILRQTTGQKGDNLTIEETVQVLHELLKGKSYLVVLDDVWQHDALRQIMLPAKSHGSKFLITTRSKDVVRFPDLGCSVHEPKRLTPPESRELFKKIAFRHQSSNAVVLGDDDDDPHVVLGKEMLRKCDGLPLAIVSLAGLLSTKKTIHEWERVKHNVSSKISEDVGPSDYGRVEDMLALSYSDLNHTLKSCFLYLGLFPEDAEIPTGMLMRLWIAEGFFKSIRLAAGETIEDVARQCLDELIERCLVQIVRVNYAGAVKAIRIHDLMRDLAIKRAKEKCFFDIIPQTSSAPGQSSTSAGTATMQPRRLWILSDNTALLAGHRSRLRSFAWSGDWTVEIQGFECIFTSYLLLRVLIIQDVKIYRLPDEIGNLIHLRYLQVIADIAGLPDSIKNLRNLLSLECGSTTISGASTPWSDFPNLKQMKQLRHLWVEVPALTYQKELNLQDLPNLKVLRTVNAGPWMTELKDLSLTVEKLGICKIENSEQLDNVYQCPSVVQDSLHTLKLEWNNAEFELQKLQHCKKLEKLNLDGVIAKGVPLDFPPYLLKLVLTTSALDDQDSLAASVGRLGYLKALRLQCYAYIGRNLAFAADSFPKLEDLRLWDLPNLVGFHVIKGGMPRLKKLQIRNCDEIKALPQDLQTITTLQELVIEYPSTELRSRVRKAETGSEVGGEDLNIIQHISSVKIFD